MPVLVRQPGLPDAPTDSGVSVTPAGDSTASQGTPGPVSVSYSDEVSAFNEPEDRALFEQTRLELYKKHEAEVELLSKQQEEETISSLEATTSQATVQQRHQALLEAQRMRQNANAGLRALNSRLRREQRQNNTKIAPPSCNICGEVFTKTAQVITHKKNKHADMLKTRRCEVCNKAFLQEQSLGQHMRRMHTDQDQEQASAQKRRADFVEEEGEVKKKKRKRGKAPPRLPQHARLQTREIKALVAKEAQKERERSAKVHAKLLKQALDEMAKKRKEAREARMSSQDQPQGSPKGNGKGGGNGGGKGKGKGKRSQRQPPSKE